jgi:ATP/maltotriose-dependent transcriptional regulator MalT
MSFDLSKTPIATSFETGAYFPTAWLPTDRGEDLRAPPTRAERCKALVLRAWSELAAMKLAEGLATIATIRAEHDDTPTEWLRLECELLHATSLALKDDPEAAVGVVESALKAHELAAAHPASLFLLRLGHWKARRLDKFCELSGSISPVPRRRREALWSVLHLSLEAAVEAEQLRLVSAGRLASDALALSARFYGPDFPGARLAATLSARILYEQNQVDAADRLIRDRLLLSGSQGGVEGALGAYIVAARIAAARRQTQFGILLLREAEQLGEEWGWPRLVAASLSERVRLLVDEGRIGEAQACARRLARLPAKSAAQGDDHEMGRLAAVCRARLELTQAVGTHTVASLQRLASDSLRRRENHLAVELLMLLACALRALGREEEATAEALRAIELGASAGLYRTFIDGGDAVWLLLAWLYERRVDNASVLGELRPYVRNLLIGFSERPAQEAGARSKHRSGESLSPRERHIVTLMSHGLSNKRIARQLGIAPETVKSHAKHIFLKLAAQTRVEVVSRALSLGII